MKIFDLQCDGGHTFEGWFGSDADFKSQLERELVACPMCGNTAVERIPSAPRLNLKRAAQPRRAAGARAEVAPESGGKSHRDMQAAWLKAVRHVMQNTEDVGRRFAQEARRIHHGEAEERGIRGQATAEETRDLLEEGISVSSLPIPASLKETLQ